MESAISEAEISISKHRIRRFSGHFETPSCFFVMPFFARLGTYDRRRIRGGSIARSTASGGRSQNMQRKNEVCGEGLPKTHAVCWSSGQRRLSGKKEVVLVSKSKVSQNQKKYIKESP